jgi:tRNA-2-methylthio-N6-dimethylallyladenosine synthase
MVQKTFHVEVYGCQMNKLDGQLAADRLRAMGLREAGGLRNADVVLFVTCSVRQHAEDRVYSNTGKLKHRKARQPGLIIGILGCMAEKDRDDIFRRLPHVDFICGPGQLDRLEDLVREAAARGGGTHLAALDAPRAARSSGDVDDHLEAFELGRLTPVGEHPFHAYVRVMRGCDNFCAYCIVPYVRGPEASRPPSAILDEVRRLVAAGVRHVTLLGQSIGSYARQEQGRQWQLADLVRAAAAVNGLVRLDFVTTHPKNLSDAIIECLAAGPPVAPYLHLPAQSGSDRVLRQMNRGYTVGEYRERGAAARRRVPGLSVAADFIVGFPGETDEDFEATVALIREMDFSQVFAFKYSVRPGTAAARLDDDVPEDTKKDRLARLLAVWSESALRSKRALIGRTVECLVTGPSRKPHLDGARDGSGDERTQLSSRSPGHQIVLFEGPPHLIGCVVPVRITRVSPITLFGELVGA